MNKLNIKNKIISTNIKGLSFPVKNNLKANHRSKSTKQQDLNKNKINYEALNFSISQSNKCVNHPQKKGQYCMQTSPNKRLCLRCNLILSIPQEEAHIIKQKHSKKIILDQFIAELNQTKIQTLNYQKNLKESIKNSQIKYSYDSFYINQSFSQLIQLLEQKRRQLLNNVIIAQRNIKKQYEQNKKQITKIYKCLNRYNIDINSFYSQIIEQLPNAQFHSIMQQYKHKLQTNIKSKLKSILIKNQINVYIPNIPIKQIINKANVTFYQVLGENLGKQMLEVDLNAKNIEDDFQINYHQNKSKMHYDDENKENINTNINTNNLSLY